MPMRKLCITRAFIIAAATAAVAVGSATADEYCFKQISLADGLSQSNVRAIMRDSRGFLWIGTKIGLNKYDYQSVSTYYNDPDNPETITSNDIRLIFEDATGQVWVAGELGTAVYDGISDKFREVTVDGRQLNIRAFHLMADGVMLAGAGPLFKYSYETGEVTTIPTTGGSHLYYNGIIELSAGRYYLPSRWNGSWLYDSATGEISQLDGLCEGDKNISAASLDAHGNLWIAPYGRGVYCYDNNLRLVSHLHQGNSGLTNDIVLNIVEKDRKLWMGTDGGGICILAPQNGTFSHINATRKGFPENSITSLYKDEYGNIFAGTVHSGAVCIQKAFMHTHKMANLSVVTSILENGDGRVWIGTDGKGLKLFDPATEQFTSFNATNEMKITSIAPYGEHGEQLLIADFTTGLHIFSKSTGTLRSLPFQQSEVGRQIASKGLHLELKRGRGNKVYILADEIYSYDTASGECSQIALPAVKDRQGRVCLFYSDERTAMIFDTHNVFSLDLESDEAGTVLSLDPKYEIVTAQYDGQRHLYIGTSVGLFDYDASTGTIGKISEEIPHGINTCLLDGDNLWIGAESLVVLYKIADRKTILFSQADGADPNEFIARSKLVTTTHAYIGGVNGLLVIDKTAFAQALEYDSEITISLCQIDIDGAPALAGIKKGSINIPSNHSTIAIGIIEKEKNAMRKQVFRYHIEGKSNSTIETTDRTLTLNILPSGKYHIKVSCKNSLGDWTEPVHLITLNVLKPWWRSGCAIVVYIVIVVLAWYISFRINSKRKKRQMDEQLNAYKQEQLEHEIDFLINISHEMRTPLTLIYAPLKLLIARLTSAHADKSTINDLEVIYRNTKKMRNVINMTLDLRRLEMGHTGLNVAQVGFNEWIRTIVDDFATAFRNRQVLLVFDFDENIGQVSIDKDKTEIVINNFLMNALKYTPAKATTRVATSLQGGYVRLSISDSGRGLDTVDMNRLFSKFYQGEGAVFGSGLGLSYSKSLIELQGGRIGAYDNDGAPGATFWFELPIEAETAQQQPQAAAAPSGNEAAGSEPAGEQPQSEPAGEAPLQQMSTAHLSAIIIEDDMELCQFIAANMKPEYAKVYTAYNGRDAMMLIRNHLPDIIISDVMLPAMSGLEICRQVKTSPQLQHIPVILLTARIDEASMQAGYNEGADSYLSKPFDMDILMTRCRNLLKNRLIIRERYTPSENAPRVDTRTNRETQKRNINNANETFLKNINDLIEKNISQVDFNIETIVEKLYMSRASVQNKFRDLTGCNLGTYITEYKVRRAKEMLEDETMSMNEIADALGFRSQRYFSTFFKKNTGFTPSAWRKAALNGEQTAPTGDDGDAQEEE